MMSIFPKQESLNGCNILFGTFSRKKPKKNVLIGLAEQQLCEQELFAKKFWKESNDVVCGFLSS